MDVHPPAPLSVDLLSRCRRGDLRALAELVHRQRPELLRTVQALGHRKLLGRFEPEDVFQETVLQALKSVKTLRAHDLAAFRAWFRAIARHRLFHLHRRDRARERPRHATPLPGSLLSYMDPISFEGREASVERVAEDPPSPFPELRADQRLAFLLRRVLAAEWDTVAFLLDRRTNDAARLLIHRAKSALERQLDPAEDRAQFLVQAPGPRGSPQVPQGPGAGRAGRPRVCSAKADIRRSSSVLSQSGQRTSS